MEVVTTADRVIDLGPEGGHRGGEVVAQGSPERIARTPDSYTGQFLAEPLGLEPVPLTDPPAGHRVEGPAPARRHGGPAGVVAGPCPCRLAVGPYAEADVLRRWSKPPW